MLTVAFGMMTVCRHAGFARLSGSAGGLTVAIEQAGYYSGARRRCRRCRARRGAGRLLPRPPGNDLRRRRRAPARHRARAHRHAPGHRSCRRSLRRSPWHGRRGDRHHRVGAPAIRAWVMLSPRVADPHNCPRPLGREMTLTVGWAPSAGLTCCRRPAETPACDADHGLEGTIASDDLVLGCPRTPTGTASRTQGMAFAHAPSARIGR